MGQDIPGGGYPLGSEIKTILMDTDLPPGAAVAALWTGSSGSKFFHGETFGRPGSPSQKGLLTSGRLPLSLVKGKAGPNGAGS